MLMTERLADDIGRVLGPDEGSRIGVPVFDVRPDVPYESGDGVEGTSSNGLAGEDTEPGLDHVEPGSALGCEVKREAGVLGKPSLDGRGGVGRGVVQDDVKLSAAVEPVESAKKTEEVSTVMGLRAMADDFSGGDLESCVEAGDPVSAVVVSLACRQTRSYWKHRLRTTESLDLSFLVQTEHDGVGGRVQVEAHDVVDLLFGLGIGGELERADAMGLKGMGLPDPMDSAVGKTRALGHVSCGPLGSTGARRLESQCDDTSSFASRDLRRSARAWSIQQTGETLLGKPTTNAADLYDRVADAPCDLDPGESLRHQQYGLGSTRKTRGNRRSSFQPFQLRAIAGTEHDRPRMIGHGASLTMP